MATNLQGSSHRPRAVGGAYDNRKHLFMKKAKKICHDKHAPGLMRYGYFHCYNNYVYGFNHNICCSLNKNMVKYHVDLCKIT